MAKLTADMVRKIKDALDNCEVECAECKKFKKKKEIAQYVYYYFIESCSYCIEYVCKECLKKQ
jgi:hypothetical protein